MTITLNGAPRELPDAPLSIADLLELLGLAGQRLAVERNGQITPRSLHPTTPLQAGDRVEIVQAIGGG